MGKVAEPPKSVDEIDSPRHRQIFDVSLIIGVKPEASYDKLLPFLGRYGHVERVVREEPNGVPFRDSNPYIVLFAMRASAERLRRDYSGNVKSPLKYITGITDYKYSCKPD